TIVGRCQRFDFRRATGEILAEHLLQVAAREGVALTADAAHTIARQAEGSFRDALSLLDQASVLGGAQIGESELSQLLGAPRAQASKFQPAELSRVISLLLAAQTDMRWTTSPRLTLELALVRATMPEADPAPEGLVARIERLERLAGVEEPLIAAQSTPGPEPEATGAPGESGVDVPDSVEPASQPPDASA